VAAILADFRQLAASASVQGHGILVTMSRSPRRLTILARTLGGCVALALALPVLAGAAPGEVAVGQVLPADTPMLGLNGPTRRLADYRGQPLLINVWASWCGPCRGEMASLERLAWRDLGLRFAIIGISTDDDAVAAKTWLNRSNATISHFIDRGLVLETLLGASRLPLTVLVDADGRVLDKVVGAREWDGAEAVQAVLQVLRRGKAARPAR
jgi:thiol-disulfide isomerase/thioredoxin